MLFAEISGAAELQARTGDAAQQTIGACLDLVQAVATGRGW